MADEPVVVPPAVTPPAVTPPAQTSFSQEYVSELRHENAAQRKARQDAEARALAAEDAVKKAGEESAAKITEAEKKANDRIIRAELKASALKAGMVDLDGLKLADLSKVKLNAESGEVEGADALMEELKKSKPFLFGTPGTTASTEKPPKPGDPEVKDVRKLSDADYRKAREDIRRGKIPAAKAT